MEKLAAFPRGKLVLSNLLDFYTVSNAGLLDMPSWKSEAGIVALTYIFETAFAYVLWSVLAEAGLAIAVAVMVISGLLLYLRLRPNKEKPAKHQPLKEEAPTMIPSATPIVTTIDSTHLLNEFSRVFNLVKQTANPQTKKGRLVDLQYKLSPLCWQVPDWNDTIRSAIRDLFDYMDKDFTDLRFMDVYLGMLLDIIIPKRTDALTGEMKTRFANTIQTVWKDDPIDDPRMIELAITMLVYFNDFELSYMTTKIHDAINATNEFADERRFAPFLKAFQRFVAGELPHKRDIQGQIIALISREEDETESKGKAHDRAKQFEKMLRDSNMWL
jgi:hypothetical protein